MTPKSVKKKLRQPSFAAAVNREELVEGAEKLGVDFDEHLTIVIAALAARQDELMPAGSGSGDSGSGSGSGDSGSGSGSGDSADDGSA
jgi:hypothetical protein